MKVILLALYMTISSTIHAGIPENDNPKRPQMQAFYQSYPGAKDIKWELQKDMFRIDFQYRGQSMFAYYTNDGEPLAISRKIQVSQLPMMAAENLSKKLVDKYLVNLFEVSMNDETSYYAIISDTETETTLKAQSSGNWTFFKKNKVKNQ